MTKRKPTYTLSCNVDVFTARTKDLNLVTFRAPRTQELVDAVLPAVVEMSQGESGWSAAVGQALIDAGVSPVMDCHSDFPGSEKLLVKHIRGTACPDGLQVQMADYHVVILASDKGLLLDTVNAKSWRLGGEAWVRVLPRGRRFADLLADTEVTAHRHGDFVTFTAPSDCEVFCMMVTE